MSGNESVRMTVVEGPKKGATFTIQAGSTIGRSRGCAVELDGRHISRVHARIEARPGGLAIIDSDSRNGIFVNGEKVRERMLRKDDEIEIGEHVLIFDPSFALDGAALPPNESSPELPRPRAGAASTVLEATLNPLADAPRECMLEAVAALRRLTYVDDERDLGQSLLDELIKATPARRGFLMVTDERGRPKPLAKRIPPGEGECRVSNVHYHQVQRRKAIIGTVT
jgi:predicted component of type VI protein secretion system